VSSEGDDGASVEGRCASEKKRLEMEAKYLTFPDATNTKNIQKI
jgi:hypothetical protein